MRENEADTGAPVAAANEDTAGDAEVPAETVAIAASGEAAVQPADAATALPMVEAAPVRRALAIGAIESIDYNHILGWAWYRPTPDEAIDVEILVDDVVVLKIHADMPRPDLEELGAGNGVHGFLVHNLAAFVRSGSHNVRVRRARDRLDIPGSPRVVVRPEPGAEGVANAAPADSRPTGSDPAGSHPIGPHLTETEDLASETTDGELSDAATEAELRDRRGRQSGPGEL
jgi:hypothetical protein